MSTLDEQEKRIETITGPDDDDASYEHSRERFFQHLCQHLQLPCEVTGIEDFNWEEPYVFGGWDQAEYNRLKRIRPSYEDTFLLLAIRKDVYSEWMMCDDDLTAEVKRKSDNKEFYLGLSEIKAVDTKTQNEQLLEDYAVWFVDNR